VKADPTLTNQYANTKEQNQGKTKKSAPEFPSWERQLPDHQFRVPHSRPSSGLEWGFFVRTTKKTRSSFARTEHLASGGFVAITGNVVANPDDRGCL